MTLSGEREPEAMARRRVLSLLGLFGALGLAAPSIWPTFSAAKAPAVPHAYDQVDKPVPGEGGGARTAPQLDKPIPAEGTGTRTHRVRRKQVRDRRAGRRKRRSTQPTQPTQPAPPQPASPGYKPW
jgi:hypothetical protein